MWQTALIFSHPVQYIGDDAGVFLPLEVLIMNKGVVELCGVVGKEYYSSSF